MPRSRTRLSNSMPDIPGIDTSKMKQSNLPAIAASSAAMPLSRSSTSKPRRRKYSARRSLISVSSSAIRRRLPACLVFVVACCAKCPDPVGGDLIPKDSGENYNPNFRRLIPELIVWVQGDKGDRVNQVVSYFQLFLCGCLRTSATSALKQP